MIFDLVSFAAGLAVGALVGVLAGYLHETETIGGLQERVRFAVARLDTIASSSRRRRDEKRADFDLRRELAELQDEIRKLYRRPGR